MDRQLHESRWTTDPQNPICTEFLKDLRKASAARSLVWSKGQPPDVEFSAIEFAGEVGEICNDLKKIVREQRGWVGSRATTQHLGEEIADVIITLDLLLNAAGLPHLDGIKWVDQTRTQVMRQGVLWAAINLLRYSHNVIEDVIWKGRPNNTGLWTSVDHILETLISISHEFNINIREAVITKFDSSSIKNSLPLFEQLI